ncbi:ribulokinase [Feifania hominis]|uniref:Ribulokinase n=1 Tax=Feifania hominis TaxID=2763660 RepID=A0A926DDS3_9FIRM|nr:ribulokinase [Feifania hominis]MBC8535987.1 ribulokinase [Feifania hominis]
MKQPLYSIGIDFGTLTARGVLVDIKTGEQAAVSVFGYQDAVIDQYLPGTDVTIPAGCALQNPMDYRDALEGLLRDILHKSSVSPEQIVGIGIDFTSCTMLPLDSDLQPLCQQPDYRENYHSWPKLWKDHTAQKQADRITSLARERGEEFLSRYGGNCSSEWMFAKILETLENAPEVYEGAFRFVEAGDWIVYLLTGELKKSSGPAGFKAFWSPDHGYPSADFFKALDPRLEHVVAKKLGEQVYPLGTRAGGLTREMAELTGLCEGTSVAVANIDAHSSFPAIGATGDSTMLFNMGTSLCHIFTCPREALVPGISGVVRDGILPDCYGYEAGQAAVGDIYDWFVRNLVAQSTLQEVTSRNVNIFQLMDEKAGAIRPGESGLLALDWWNGNRSMLCNSDLSGMIVGLTLSTRPEEIYRALIEGTAFGSRRILSEFERDVSPVREIYACGGLSRKSRVVMQIFADVLGRRIHISGVQQTSAFGAAIYGAVAAGSGRGGYDTVSQASAAMAKPSAVCYQPNPRYAGIYDRLYREYEKLHDYFGTGASGVMKELRNINHIATKK